MRQATKSILTSAVFVMGLASVSQAATITIDFGGLAGSNGDAYTGHVEDGFTVTPFLGLGSWFEAHAFGNPQPSLFAGPVGSPSQSMITVTDGGGLFTFESVDLSCNNSAECTYILNGLVGGNTVLFTEVGIFPGVSVFNTIFGLDNLTEIDQLDITLIPGAGATSMNLDNIVLNQADEVPEVPEPATLGLLGVGLAVLAGVRRRLPR